MDVVHDIPKQLGFVPKDKQMEVIQANIDVFSCLHTGYGKSLCYAILPKVFGTTGSIVLIIPPLVTSLMDQQEKFLNRGLTTQYNKLKC